MVEIGDILVLVCASGRAVRLSGPILKDLIDLAIKVIVYIYNIYKGLYRAL